MDGTSRAAAEEFPEVVVVAYGAPELLRRALAPLSGRMPVTVVDNSSMREIEVVSRRACCAYHDPGCNGGFASGVNYALDHRQAPGRDVLLLNPDAVVLPEDVSTLQRALSERPGAASVTAAQHDAAGRPSQVSWPFPTPARFAADAVRLAHRLRAPARYVVGSVLLLRARALEEVGRFDERFFLYFEETDWEYRAHLAGWTNEVVEEATALHVGAGTSTDDARHELQVNSSLEKYVRKHFGSRGWQASRAAVVVGSCARAAVHRGASRRVALRRAALYARGPVRAARAAGAEDRARHGSHGRRPSESVRAGDLGPETADGAESW